jgi:hypothetical protein
MSTKLFTLISVLVPLFMPTTQSPFSLLKTMRIQHTSNLPIGFTDDSDTSPHTLSIFTQSSINPISKREYLTSAKFTLTDPKISLPLPLPPPTSYDLFDHLSETPAFTYLENHEVSLTNLHPDIFVLQVKVVSSDCLAPLFLLDDNKELDYNWAGGSVYLNVAKAHTDNHNRFLDFLQIYHEFKGGTQVKLVNGFNENKELYLKVFCFYWFKPVAPKMVLELFFDRKSHIDIALGNHHF